MMLLRLLSVEGLKIEKTEGAENKEKYVWMSEHDGYVKSSVYSNENKPWNYLFSISIYVI